MITLLNLSQVMAQSIDHTFSYQGELLENGSPITGLYDFRIEGFDAAGNSKTNVSEHQLIVVADGLFTIPNVDLGVAGLDAFATFLQISVKPGIGIGAYTDLTPRQSLKSVPYATKVIDGNASNGQVYTYGTTTGWAAADPVDLSPWTRNLSRIQFLEDVAIGTVATATTHKLTVLADVADNDGALRLIGTQGAFGFGAKLNFGDGTFIQIEEDVDDHLKIFASSGIEFASKTQQPLAIDGQIKFMINANCASTASISKQYNGVNDLPATIVAGGINGLCTITFPFDISDRFYQVSSVEDLIATNATCQTSGTDLNCARHRSSTGVLLPGQIMIMVY